MDAANKFARSVVAALTVPTVEEIRARASAALVQLQAERERWREVAVRRDLDRDAYRAQLLGRVACLYRQGEAEGAIVAQLEREGWHIDGEPPRRGLVRRLVGQVRASTVPAAF